MKRIVVVEVMVIEVMMVEVEVGGRVMVVEVMVMEVMMVEVEVGSHVECAVLRLLGCAAESLQRDSFKRRAKQGVVG